MCHHSHAKPHNDEFNTSFTIFSQNKLLERNLVLDSHNVLIEPTDKTPKTVYEGGKT